jgi:hypothetical protein
MRGVDWIHLAQDRNQWQALENKGGKPASFHKMLGMIGNSFT